MKFTDDLKIDTLTDPAFTKAWEEHEQVLREHINRMHEMVEIAMEYAALSHLGQYPTDTQVAEYGVCAVHLDGRREYKWAGKTVAIMHPWVDGQPPRVEIFK